MSTKLKRSMLLACCAALLVAGPIGACSSKNKKRDEMPIARSAESRPVGQPPGDTEGEPAEVPSGAPVLSEDVRHSNTSPEPRGDRARAEASPQEEAGAQAEGSEGEGASSAEGHVGSVERHEVAALMSRGPAHLLQAVTVSPARDSGGTFRGYRIDRMTDSAREEVAPHLRAGDVITHLNGVRVRKPNDYMTAWKSLGEAEKLRVDFLRDGRKHHVYWDVVE